MSDSGIGGFRDDQFRDSELEERLRSALHAEAAQVSPDPRTWDMVQRRIRRGTWLRFGSVGLVAAALVAVVVIAVPDLLRVDRQIEFAPATAPPATEPLVEPEPVPQTTPTSAAPVGPPQPTPTAAFYGDPAIGGLVLSTSDQLLLAGPEGDERRTLVPHTSGCGAQAAPAVRPGSSAERPVVAVVSASSESGCGGPLEIITVTPAGDVWRNPSPLPGPCCATAPVWSPDGRAVAWTQPSVDGAAQLTIAPLGTDETFPDIGVSSAAGFGLDGVVGEGVRVLEWSWNEVSAEEASGSIVLTDGQGQLWELSVERQADGAYAVTGTPGPFAVPQEVDLGGAGLVDLERSVTGSGEAIEWLLARLEAGGALLVAVAGNEVSSIRIAPGNFATAEDSSGPWLDAVGSTALLGNGADQVLRADAGGPDIQLTVLEEVSGPVVSGALVPATGVASSEGAPSESAPADTPLSTLGVPEPVSDTAEAIYDAAEAESWDRLAALLPDDEPFYSQLEAQHDHITYYQDLQASGENIFADIRTILALPPAESTDGAWEWPSASVRPIESLSASQRQAYVDAFGEEAVSEWEQAGAYLGWRLRIEADGTWRHLNRAE